MNLCSVWEGEGEKERQSQSGLWYKIYTRNDGCRTVGTIQSVLNTVFIANASTVLSSYCAQAPTIWIRLSNCLHILFFIRCMHKTAPSISVYTFWVMATHTHRAHRTMLSMGDGVTASLYAFVVRKKHGGTNVLCSVDSLLACLPAHNQTRVRARTQMLTHFETDARQHSFFHETTKIQDRIQEKNVSRCIFIVNSFCFRALWLRREKPLCSTEFCVLSMAT